MATKNYDDKFNDTKSRRVSNTRSGFVSNAGAENVFGTPEEVGSRIGRTYKRMPDNMPSNFKQLGPDGPGASNPIKGNTRAYSGNQKFGDPKRYGV